VPTRTLGRIQTRAAFAQLQRSRARATSGPVRASFVPAGAPDTGVYPQVGYAIGTRCGNAVVRNTLRRRARESARSIAGTLTPGRYLLRLEPAAARCEYADLSAHVQRALQTAAHQGVSS
jgi:ribonuclease P protein component